MMQRDCSDFDSTDYLRRFDDEPEREAAIGNSARLARALGAGMAWTLMLMVGFLIGAAWAMSDAELLALLGRS
jgi:hypothetical protein